MIEIYDGALPTTAIYEKWYQLQQGGMLLSFTGIVRADNNIDGLSFDIYEPMLNEWFAKWQNRVLMAHSRGDVLVGQSSFMCGVYAKHREFRLIEEFVEDFKANAPIWKYDLVGNQRIFAKDRSHKLPYAGILRK
ncbi:MAG: molybdenum cofactor biosynthesis protein MoaE [Epsilonproteobacteria bacterium]|nr:molybdenum cofactor biosynthesis protein MoaE [Campylobacterota bacterium]